MRQHWRRFAIPALILLLISATPFVYRASGQDNAPTAATPIGTPSVAGVAARFLPDASGFGDGWTVAALTVPGADPAVFSDTSGASYFGPVGARIKIEVYVNLSGRAALQRSWEDTTFVFDQLRSGYQSDAELERLAAIPFPEGCVDVKRSDEVNPLWPIGTGITLCAVDPDVIILTLVAGTINGITGVAASDYVAGLTVATGSGG